MLIGPGGFIQWSEQDPTANRIVVAPDAPTSSRFTEEIMSFLNNPRQTINFEYGITSSLQMRTRFPLTHSLDGSPNWEKILVNKLSWWHSIDTVLWMSIN